MNNLPADQQASKKAPPQADQHQRTTSPSQSAFDMTSLGKELPKSHKRWSIERPVLKYVEMDDENENTGGEDKKQPVSRRRARNSIEGSTDFVNATNRLSRYVDKSQDHMIDQINTIQISNVNWFDAMEARLLEQAEEQEQQIEAFKTAIQTQIGQKLDEFSKNHNQTLQNTFRDIKSSQSPSPAASVTTAFRTPTNQPAQPQQPYVPPHHRKSVHETLAQEDVEDADDEDFVDNGKGIPKRWGRAGIRSRDKSSTPLAPVKPPQLQSEPISTVRKTEFKPHEIGYFYPGLVVSKEYPDGPYVMTGKDTFYRDVNMFIQQAKRVGRSKPDLVAANLHLCLRGSAMTWFSCLKTSRQDSLSDDLTLFCTALVEKYKQSHSQAFDRLHAERYTMEDAKNRRPADDYVQSMLLTGQSCDQSIAAVLTLAWKNLDQELQRDVHRPNGDPDDFARNLDDAADYWASRSLTVGASSMSKPVPYQNSYNQGSRREQVTEDKEAAFQRGLRAGERRQILPPQNQQGSIQNRTYQQTPALPPPQSRGYYPGPSNATPRRQITANHASMAEEKEGDVEDIGHGNGHDDDMEYAHFGATTEYYNDNGNHTSFNDGDYAQHGVPPHSCNVCYVTFVNNAEIDKHMLEEHGVDTRSSTSIGSKRYANWIEHAALHVVIIRPPPSNRGYATIHGHLYSEDGREQDFCIDTGSTTTFVDETLLPPGNNYGVLQNCSPITVRGISGERVVDRRMDISLFITSNDGGKLRIDAKAFVTKGIKAGVILGMDELGRPEDDIALWLGRKIMQIKGINIPINFTSPGSKPVAFFSDVDNVGHGNVHKTDSDDFSNSDSNGNVIAKTPNQKGPRDNKCIKVQNPGNRLLLAFQEFQRIYPIIYPKSD